MSDATESTPQGWYSRGYLPHFDSDETTQMVTFRLADSLPAHVLESWRRELRITGTRDPRLVRRIDAYIDSGHGECILRNPEAAQIVQNALLHFDDQRYHLHAWVVMPNHVHALLTPMRDHRLAGILRSWKSYTAKCINQMLGGTGTLWQREYFDRFIRDERHYHDAIHYIHQNPVTARLCALPEDWPFSSARLSGCT